MLNNGIGCDLVTIIKEIKILFAIPQFSMKIDSLLYFQTGTEID